MSKTRQAYRSRRAVVGRGVAVMLAALIVAAGCSGEEEPRNLGIGTDAPPATTDSATPSPSPSPSPTENSSPSSTVTLSPDQQATFDAAAQAYRDYIFVGTELSQRGIFDDYAAERLLEVVADPAYSTVRASLLRLEEAGQRLQGGVEVVWIHPVEVGPDEVTLQACGDYGDVVTVGPDGEQQPDLERSRIQAVVYFGATGPLVAETALVDGVESTC